MSIYQRDPAAPGANVGRRRGQSDLRLEAAVERFNESNAGRIVSGLSRSLGKPRASVGAAAGSSRQVRVTVAWELCWYQWMVDLIDGGVCEIGKGEAIEQLDRAATHWNASVTSAGAVAFGAVGLPPRRRRWLGRR